MVKIEIIFYYDKKKLVQTYFYDSYFKTPSISKFEYVFDVGDNEIFYSTQKQENN